MNTNTSPSRPRVSRPRAVIVGGGTAGAHAASILHRRDIDLTIVEPTGTHQFLTRLAAVAGGTQPASDAAAPLREMFDATIVEACAVDATGSTVTLDTGVTLDADAVLLTTGAEPADAPIEGLESALALRSAAHAMTIRDRLPSSDAVVIVGGGPTGCQLAGAIARAHRDIAVMLVEYADQLMPAFGSRLGRHARKILTDRGVTVRLESEAEKVAEDSVVVGGETLNGTVIWAGGFEASMQSFGSTTDGRLDIDVHGRVAGHETLFAAGDAAAHRDDSGELHAMSAQIAAQAGRRAGRTIAALLAGDELRPMKLHDRGWVADLGGGVGVAELFGVSLATAWLDRLVPPLHHIIDLRNLYQLGGLDLVRRYRPGAQG